MGAIVNGGTFYIGGVGGASGGGSSLNYSTEEQVVGTWIDGRPVYQKTYVVNGINAASGHFTIDEQDYIYFFGVAKVQTSIIPLGTDWDNSYKASCYYGDGQMNYQFGSWGDVENKSIILTAQYTKTTD